MGLSFQVIPSCLAIVFHKRYPRQDAQGANNVCEDKTCGLELFHEFRQINLLDLCDSVLSECILSMQYLGCIFPYTLLVGGSKVTRNTIEKAWRRHQLKSPTVYQIFCIGEVSEVALTPIVQSELIKIDHVIMGIVADLNRQLIPASVKNIYQGISSTYISSDQAMKPDAIEHALSRLLLSGNIFELDGVYQISEHRTESGTSSNDGSEKCEWQWSRRMDSSERSGSIQKRRPERSEVTCTAWPNSAGSARFSCRASSALQVARTAAGCWTPVALPMSTSLSSVAANSRARPPALPFEEARSSDWALRVAGASAAAQRAGAEWPRAEQMGSDCAGAERLPSGGDAALQRQPPPWPPDCRLQRSVSASFAADRRLVPRLAGPHALYQAAPLQPPVPPPRTFTLRQQLFAQHLACFPTRPPRQLLTFRPPSVAVDPMSGGNEQVNKGSGEQEETIYYGSVFDKGEEGRSGVAKDTSTSGSETLAKLKGGAGRSLGALARLFSHGRRTAKPPPQPDALQLALPTAGPADALAASPILPDPLALPHSATPLEHPTEPVHAKTRCLHQKLSGRSHLHTCQICFICERLNELPKHASILEML